MGEPRFHTMPDGRKIAFRKVAGAGPALVFLPGYMSDMAGSKATALLDWAAANGRACVLFDYSGCGESAGDFADGTLSRWCEEAVAIVRYTDGRAILVGSSMGGWLMLLAGLALHGAGMTLKYRLETRDGPPVPWERALFWGCWAGLGGILAWVAWRLAVGG